MSGGFEEGDEVIVIMSSFTKSEKIAGLKGTVIDTTRYSDRCLVAFVDHFDVWLMLDEMELISGMVIE